MDGGKLLATILGIPADRVDALVHQYGGLSGLRASALAGTVRGLTGRQLAVLTATMELVGTGLLRETTQICDPAGIYQAVRAQLAGLEQEHFLVVSLNTKMHILHVHTLYIGCVNSVSCRIGEIFREAIRAGATSVVLVHNHPSGDPTPSSEDVAVTRTAIDAGKLLDVEVIDHLVVGADRFVSLKERRLGFI